jgi:hypothetical protein
MRSATARAHSISPAAPQLAQKQRVQSLPDARLLPLVQAAIASRAGAEAELERQMPPRDPGMQHEQDPPQRSPIIQPLPTRMPEPPLLLR